MFITQKKSGKWRMLTDLIAVNAVIVPMGALQPGLPNPSRILRNLHLFAIDLRGCFFTIFYILMVNLDLPFQFLPLI